MGLKTPCGLGLDLRATTTQPANMLVRMVFLPEGCVLAAPPQCVLVRFQLSFGEPVESVPVSFISPQRTAPAVRRGQLKLVSQPPLILLPVRFYGVARIRKVLCALALLAQEFYARTVQKVFQVNGNPQTLNQTSRFHELSRRFAPRLRDAVQVNVLKGF